MQIAKNTVVSLHYVLRRGTAEGELIEETTGKEPLVFLYGAGQMIPAFEDQLAGKKSGDDFSFGIPSGEAYGDYDPEAVGGIPLESFRVNGEIAHEMLVVGRVLPLRDPEGNLVYGTVVEVKEKEEEVILNFNHPMAGVDLHFTGKIEEIRPASEEEINHGHVHGAGGHQH